MKSGTRPLSRENRGAPEGLKCGPYQRKNVSEAYCFMPPTLVLEGNLFNLKIVIADSDSDIVNPLRDEIEGEFAKFV